jgi:hypothetical protein
VTADARRSRRPTSRVVAAAICVAVAAAGIGVARALTDRPRNLVANPSFGHATEGWAGWHADLSRVRGARSDTWALRVVADGTQPGFSVYTATRPLVGGVPGRLFRGSAWTRSASPRPDLCLLVREWSSSARQVGMSRSCMPASRRWRRFPEVVYTTRTRGGELELAIVRRLSGSGGTFFVDDAQLVSAGG